DGGPLVLPIVLDEPPFLVVVVVEAPGHEGATGRVVGEPLLVLGDSNPRHLVRLRLGRHARKEGHHQTHRRDCPAHTASLPVTSIPSGYSTPVRVQWPKGGAPCRQPFSPSGTRTTP